MNLGKQPRDLFLHNSINHVLVYAVLYYFQQMNIYNNLLHLKKYLKSIWNLNVTPINLNSNANALQFWQMDLNANANTSETAFKCI